MAKTPHDVFKQLYETLCAECGANPKFKLPQCDAWYKRFGEYKAPEVVRLAFQQVAVATKHTFPTLSEVLEAVRQAEIRLRGEVAEEFSDETCNFCANSGAVMVVQIGDKFYPQSRVPFGGKPYLFRCRCPQQTRWSSSIPLYLTSLVDDEIGQPCLGSSSGGLTREEVTIIIDGIRSRIGKGDIDASSSSMGLPEPTQAVSDREDNPEGG